jgi:hypothetical protein
MPNTAVFQLPLALSTHNMKKAFIVITLVGFWAASCKKETAPPTIPPVVQEDLEMKRITSAPWKIYRVEVSGLDLYNLAVPACQQDDTYRFYKDSTLMQYENGNICSGNPDSTATYWAFYDGKKKLIGTVLGLTDTATVVTLEDALLKLSVDYNGSPAVIFFKK